MVSMVKYEKNYSYFEGRWADLASRNALPGDERRHGSCRRVFRFVRSPLFDRSPAPGGCLSLGIGRAQGTWNCQPPAAGIPTPQGGGCFPGSFHDLRRGRPRSAVFKPFHGIDSRFGFGESCSITLRSKLALISSINRMERANDKQEKADYRLGTPSRWSC